jgi:hypothetical protein
MMSTIATKLKQCAAIATLTIASGMSNSSAAVNLQDMAGYWTGTGKLTLSNGTFESIKCVVTYKVTGSQLKQNVRCASPGYSLNGTAELVVSASGAVSGNWSENQYAATGDVVGKATDNGFSLTVTGPAFSAVMDASTTACKQQLDIVPKGLSVSRISVGLAKC